MAMFNQKIFEEIRENIIDVITRSSELGQELWNELTQNTHPADIAQFLSNLYKDEAFELYATFDDELKISVFEYFSDNMKVAILPALSDKDKLVVLEHLPAHDLVDFFDRLDDEEVKNLFKLMQKKDRRNVIELMKFGPDSAGGIMETDVISFHQDLTVEKAIQILQKIQPKKEIHQEIYVTDRDNKLVGHIKLEDLVLKSPKTVLHDILRENDFIAYAEQDQEEVAQKMVHYHLMNIPVITKENQFLGVIPSDTLVDVIEEEASEDVYRMSAMTPIKHTYFETPFFRLLWERSFILVALLLLESLSTTILESFDSTLAGFYLTAFITMIVSAGGNTSSQTSALAIQGLSSGEINFANMSKFLKREFLMSLAISSALGVTAFLRVYFIRHEIWTSLAVAVSLSSIVTLSVILGSILPIILKRFKIDPAFSAGPFLATIMDIFGSLIFCYIAKLILT